MKSHKPAIVVAAFNRAFSLQRVLKSIDNARYQERDITLIISIDKSDRPEVAQIANDFKWRFGNKLVLEQTENLGLRRHILKCGDLTEEHQNIILLEDDLYVSPYFYEYAQAALQFYKDEDRVAGVSLYSHRYNETAFMRFTPLKDSDDTYFMQVPSSWGQAWTHEQWSRFRNWYDKNGLQKASTTAEVPPNVLLWPETSWKKYYFKYIIEKDLYFVYPYVSLSTNFADIGTHHVDNRTTLQVPLQKFDIQHRFPKFETAPIVYDSHCELTEKSFKSLCPKLSNHDFEVDLYGVKDIKQIEKKHILTSRKYTGAPVFSFGRQFKPHEMNITFDNPGSVFNLVETKAVIDEPFDMIDSNRNSFYYDVPEHFLLKSTQHTLSEEQIAADGNILSEYHAYQSLKKQRTFKLFHFIFELEERLRKRT